MENRTRYAVLGALTASPMSGYDLKRFFEQGVSFFWTESYGQIYPILRQLEADGLIAKAGAGRSEPVDATSAHPRRAVYAITASGRATLARWLSEPAEPQQGRRIEILLKLFFVRQAGPDATRAALRLVEDFRAHHAALLATYAATDERLRSDHANHADLPYWLLTLSYGQHVSEALVAWCDETARALTALRTPTRTAARTPSRRKH